MGSSIFIRRFLEEGNLFDIDFIS